ncbi:alkaline phytoceramidase [Nitrosomonas halophila]|uniref:Ceramidase n=1 Tax=Nitrosomonas halophila TaxID=44576 RepID=A0A1H3I702_9PROT|nr:alkaline phytoceramidase [Nitrosomonas halophila]SDY22989.1 Ceramidase [Nitrosomonas halophila]
MRTKLYLLLMLAILLPVVAFFLPPISQPHVYHDFADQRVWLGMPNFWNIVSNLPFLFVGLAGLKFLYAGAAWQQPSLAVCTVDEYRSYLVVFASIVLVFPGSAYYHWNPDNSGLFWDRLPIALGIMALLSAVLIERVPIKRAALVLGVLVSLGGASVLFWYWSEQQGEGNLNFYIATQFGAPLLIILLVRFFPSRYTRSADIYGVLAWYALAKLAELLDEFVYQLGEVISGHALKHLLAGLAVYWLLRMLKRRKLLSHEVIPAGH